MTSQTSSDPASDEIDFFKIRCEIKLFLFVKVGKMKILNVLFYISKILI